MRRVFVSYSRNDLDSVTQLIDDLHAVGVDTWHDQTLTGGQRWWDNILANLRECDIFVFCLSRASLDSEACKSELSYAVKVGRSVLPVLVSDGVNLNLLPAPLNEIQVTDYRRHDKEAAFALVRSINTVPPAPALVDPLPAPPQVPVSYLGTLKERIDFTGQLNPQDQNLLFMELEEAIAEGRSPTEVRDLLLSLKRRDDLLAKVAAKIDAALKSLNDQTVAQPREDRAPESKRSPSAEADRGARDHRPAAEPKHCPHCRTQVQPGTGFCPTCGAALREVDGAKAEAPVTFPPPEKRIHTAPGSKSRRYICPAADTPQLIAEVKSWLDPQGFDCQEMKTDSESLLLQIKKRGGWRDFVGMATSLNIVFHQSEDTLTVEIGAGKWIDKAAAGTVSLFLLWPLAVTAGFGAWEQMKMPEKVFDFIGSRLVYK
ncbi:MAG TPA: TIR domain-containing protein [Blastocatellia bacterium]|nr:TIR domain-containing protein [Blastocatellia bacterium]